MESEKISMGYPVSGINLKSNNDLNTQLELNTLVNTKQNEIETQRELPSIKPKSSPEFIKSTTYTRVLKLLKFSKCGILVNTFIDIGSIIGIIFIVLGLSGIKNLRLCYLFFYIFWQIITIIGYSIVADLLQRVEFNIFCAIIISFKIYSIVIISILIINIRLMSVQNKLFILNYIKKNPIVVCIYC